MISEWSCYALDVVSVGLFGPCGTSRLGLGGGASDGEPCQPDDQGTTFVRL